MSNRASLNWQLTTILDTPVSSLILDMPHLPVTYSLNGTNAILIPNFNIFSATSADSVTVFTGNGTVQPVATSYSNNGTLTLTFNPPLSAGSAVFEGSLFYSF